MFFSVWISETFRTLIDVLLEQKYEKNIRNEVPVIRIREGKMR
jgi:hypothetical protein